MKKLLFTIAVAFIISINANAQCLYVESILADACNAIPPCPIGATEGQNEMVLFKVGNAALTIAYTTTTTAAGLVPTWPNFGNKFKGWQTPGALTNPLVAALNSSIVKCGYLKEPVGGVLPANSQVLIITSTDMCTSGNSFANLTDTFYVLFQIAGNTNGHFVNNNNNSTITTSPTGIVAIRNFTLAYSGTPSCTQTVSYQAQLLTNIFGTYGGSAAQNDGAAIEYDLAGNPTYVNKACQAPYIPISVNLNTSASACSNATPTITGIVSGPAVTYSWVTSGTGNLSTTTGTLSGSNTTTLSPTYTPGSGETGAITFTLSVQGKCSLAVVTNMVSIFINPTPSPTITSSNGTTLCNGNSTLLTASNSGTLTTTYAWNPGGATTSTLSVNPPTGVQIYTLTATNACGTNNSTFTITTNPLPTIIVPNDSICPGGTGTLTASGANTYTWTNGAQTTTLSASPSSNTSFSVTGTNLNGCKNTTSGFIIIRTLPTITTNTNSICAGITSTLTASGGATNSYTFTPGGPTGTNTYILTPNGASVITVTGANIFGCKNTNTIMVNAQPTVTVNNPTTCSGQAVTLQASPNSLVTYTWTGVSSSASSATVSPSSTASYTVIATDVNGCISNAAISTVSVTAGSQISVSSSNALPCIGSTYTLTANGATTYTWVPSLGTFTSLNGNSTQISVVQGVTPITFSVSGVGSCPATPTVITINPAPVTTLTVTASPANATVCSGGTVTLTASGATSYTWTPSITNGIAFTPASSNNYTVNATDANGCATTQATQSITVNSLPVFTVNSPSVCTWQTATLTASQSTYTYTWQGSAITGTSIVVTPVSFPTQTYTLQALDFNGCLSSVVTSTVSTFNSPTISVTSNPANATVCAGNTITLTGNGAVTYTFTGGIFNGTAFTPSLSQQYTVSATDINGCNGTATQSVTVNSLPNLTATSASICFGGSATLMASGALTYTWSTLAQTSTITVQPSSSQNYTVVGTDVNNCSNSAVAMVLVTNLPTITINPSSTSICLGNTVTLTANGAGTSGIYSWDNGFGSNPLITTQSVTTTYTVTGTDANNCTGVSSITITTLPMAASQTINPVGVLCKGLTTVLSTNNVSGNTYTWTGPAGFNQTGSSVTVNQGGTYTLNISNGCGPIAPVTTTIIKDSVIAGFTANPISGQSPLSVTYANTSVALAGNTIVNNAWSFGNNSTSTVTNPTEIFTGAGVYQTTLTATDNKGCYDVATTTITVTDVPAIISIPNIFSPNGDNINDLFFITATGYSNFTCKVYDRWGLLLHDWDGFDGFWDGKAKNGMNCSDGTYFYMITYTDNLGKSFSKNSFFQLIR